MVSSPAERVVPRVRVEVGAARALAAPTLPIRSASVRNVRGAPWQPNPAGREQASIRSRSCARAVDGFVISRARRAFQEAMCVRPGLRTGRHAVGSNATAPPSTAWVRGHAEERRPAPSATWWRAVVAPARTLHAPPLALARIRSTAPTTGAAVDLVTIQRDSLCTAFPIARRPSAWRARGGRPAAHHEWRRN